MVHHRATPARTRLRAGSKGQACDHHAAGSHRRHPLHYQYWLPVASAAQRFPTLRTVYEYFNRWDEDGTLDRIHNGLRDQVRESAGRKAEPTAAILVAQAVKTAGPGEDQGYDGFKKIKGRKRSIAVDVMGLLLVLVVHSASEHDKKGGRRVIEQLFEVCPTIRKVWADGGYDWQDLRDLIQGFGGELETILPVYRTSRRVPVSTCVPGAGLRNVPLPG